MLGVLDDFRNRMSSVLCKCINKPVILFGYGYSGRFVGWYAEYYHSIKPVYIVSEDMRDGMPYEFQLFKKSIFDFNYGITNQCIVLMCTDNDEANEEFLEKHGYEKNVTYYNMNEVIYGENYDRKASGINVQFLRYLEKEYKCDLVNKVVVNDFSRRINGMHPFIGFSPKELFPILDKCHCIPGEKDGVFDFGCGKGGALLSFLDYGFNHAGGVEYAENIYSICQSNLKNLGLKAELFLADAREIKEELDKYNWFYMFDPFASQIVETVIDNICESLYRKPRRIKLIYINPKANVYIGNKKELILVNQFDIATRQRVVNVYQSIC